MDSNHPTNIHKRVPRKYFIDYLSADREADPNKRILKWKKLIKDLRKDLVLSDDSKEKIKGLIEVAQSEIEHTESVIESSIKPPYPEFDGIIYGGITKLEKIQFVEQITNNYEPSKLDALAEAFEQYLRFRKQERTNTLIERETLNQLDGEEPEPPLPNDEYFSRGNDFLEWLEIKIKEQPDKEQTEEDSEGTASNRSTGEANQRELTIEDCKEAAQDFIDNAKNIEYSRAAIAFAMKVGLDHPNETVGSKLARIVKGKQEDKNGTVLNPPNEIKGANRDTIVNWISQIDSRAGIERTK